MLGLSNVSLRHLEQMESLHRDGPSFVQNRCYANRGWDREVRLFCNERAIVYQGFSLLTANPGVLRHPRVRGIAARLGATPAQIVFGFSHTIGILPLTGTSVEKHMKEDVASLSLPIRHEAVRVMEFLIR